MMAIPHACINFPPLRNLGSCLPCVLILCLFPEIDF
jgi:hypothetical protein